MSEIKTIKGVSDETWAEFKSMAARHEQSMGSFFDILVAFYKQKSKSFWDEILEHKPILSEKEAEELSRYTKAIRKERWFKA